MSRSKRSISNNLNDIQCVMSFERSDKTIIRTNASRENGAVFLEEVELESFDLCLRYCCDTTLCDVATYDHKVSDDDL